MVSFALTCARATGRRRLETSRDRESEGIMLPGFNKKGISVNHSMHIRLKKQTKRRWQLPATVDGAVEREQEKSRVVVVVAVELGSRA